MKRRVLVHLTAKRYGGVETHSVCLAGALSDAGLDVTLVSHRDLDLDLRSMASLSGRGVTIIAPPAINHRLPGLVRLVVARAHMLARLESKGYDCVIGQGHGGAFGWMKRFRRPDGTMLWHEYWYGVPTRGDRYEAYASPRAERFSYRMRRMVSSVDGIVVGCARAAMNLRQVQSIRKPIRVIPPLDDIGVPPRADGRRYGAGSVLRLVMIGRVGVGKGVKALLNIWRDLDIGPAELHFYGPFGEDARDLVTRSEVDKRVFFHGAFPRESLDKIMGSADMGLFLSIEEGFGLVALEYMAYGVPFVATDVGAVPEFVRDSEDAMMVPVDMHEVRKGIERMAKRIRSGSTSRKRLQAAYLERFSMREIAAEHVAAVSSREWLDGRL